MAIGRAIARQRRMFLFNAPLRAQIRVEQSQLPKPLHATVIHVSHDQVVTMTLAEQIIGSNEGLIEQVGKPINP